MKIKTAALVIICLMNVSPLFADYSSMNETIKNYTPPEFYTDSLKFKAEDTGPELSSKLETDPVSSEIKTLKQTYEKKISNGHGIYFLQDSDTELFKRIAAMASDQKAVKAVLGRNIKLNEIEIMAGLRNPAILAAHKKIRAKLESFNQVMALDDILKQYSAFTGGLNNQAGPLKMKESIKQKYPFPGLTSLKGRIIEQQVAALVEKMKIVERNVITETRRAYWGIVFIGQSENITSETIDAFNRLKNVATILYRSGKTSFQDIIKINIEIEVLKENLITLSSKKKNIEVKLSELLNLPPDTRMGTIIVNNSDKKIPDPEELYPIARRNRQELKVVRHQISKMQNMIEMAESMIQAPFTLNFSTYENEAVNTVGTGAVKASFPGKTMAAMKTGSPSKPWYGVDAPWLSQTKQELLSLKQTLVKKENATDEMVRQAWFLVDKDKRELKLYQNRILSLSKSALDVSTREYEVGSIPFSQAIGSYTYWLKVKLTIAKKQTDVGGAIANLEKMIGITLR